MSPIESLYNVDLVRSLENASGDVEKIIEKWEDRISVVERAGSHFSLDHRRLYAYKKTLPGDAMVWVWCYVGRCPEMFFSASKYSTVMGGQRVVVLPRGTKEDVSCRYSDKGWAEMRALPDTTGQILSATQQDLIRWRKQ
jgi:hypothetical protein